MGILNITTDVAGQIGVKPRRVAIITTDSLATVTTAGYLNNANLMGYTIQPTDEIVMWYDYVDSASPGTMGIFNAEMTGGHITLVEWVNPGDVVIPTVVNDIAVFNTTSGQIKDSGTHFSNNTYSVAPTLKGAASNYLAVFTSDNSLDALAASGTAISPGNIQAGLSGTAGGLFSFPSTALKGSLELVASDNTGNTLTQITNAAFGQASVLTIPDPGAASANFLLDTGAGNLITDNQWFVSTTEILTTTAGTWAFQRNGAADYVFTKAANAETAIVGYDLTVHIRTAASKGMKLTSVDVIYGIATDALVSHTGALYTVSYTNNTPTTTTAIPLTGSLATATQVNLYSTNLVVTTPAFLNTAESKYVFEITLQSAATTNYAIYGMNLRFTDTIA